MTAAAWALFQCSRENMFQPKRLQDATALHCNFTELDKAEHFNKIDANSGYKTHPKSTCKILLTQGNHNCWRQCLLLPIQGLLRPKLMRPKSKNSTFLIRAEGKTRILLLCWKKSRPLPPSWRFAMLLTACTQARLIAGGSCQAPATRWDGVRGGRGAASSAPLLPPGTYGCMGGERGQQKKT